MMGACAYPGCGGGFERKRSDAQYCSDTCRAKASKDRARAGREGAERRGSRPRGAPAATSAGEASALAERLTAMERRLTAAEAGVTRAEADRAGWRKVRNQLHAALARVGKRAGTVSAESLAAAVRAEVGPQLAKLGKRLDAVEAVGKLTTRVSIIERDVRAYGEGVGALGGGGQRVGMECLRVPANLGPPKYVPAMSLVRHPRQSHPPRSCPEVACSERRGPLR
jgi:hypothetical protein